MLHAHLCSFLALASLVVYQSREGEGYFAELSFFIVLESFRQGGSPAGSSSRSSDFTGLYKSG